MIRKITLIEPFGSDFQIDQAKQKIQYAGSIDDGIGVVKML